MARGRRTCQEIRGGWSEITGRMIRSRRRPRLADDRPVLPKLRNSYAASAGSPGEPAPTASTYRVAVVMDDVQSYDSVRAARPLAGTQADSS